MITTWKISQIEREASDGFVFCVYYEIHANRDTCSSSYCGRILLERPDDGFIPFENLTETIIVDWVKSVLGPTKLAFINEELGRRLDEQARPTILSGLPWDNA